MIDELSLERYLHEQIPLSSAMQVSVESATSESVVLAAPLAPNTNHKLTAFGGSVSALGILAAWSLLHVRLVEAGQDCEASEVAAMEEELLAEGIPANKLIALCDLHAQAVCGEMATLDPRAVPAGHPLDVFRRENVALGQEVARLRACLVSLAGEADDAPATPAVLAELDERCRRLGQVHKHYQRKELLYALTNEVRDALAASRRTKRSLARQLGTSLAQIARLLDPADSRKSVDQMVRLLAALGRRLEVHVEELHPSSAR